MRWLLLVGAACTLSIGCAPNRQGDRPSSGQVVFISGVVILNELPYTVTNVMVEVPATGGFAGCDNIPPRSECSNDFQERGYRTNPLRIRWAEHGQPHQTAPFVLKAPTGASPGGAFRVEVIVFAPGQAGARLVDAQAEPVRNR